MIAPALMAATPSSSIPTTFVNYVAAAGSTVNIGSSGRLAGDLLILNAISSSDFATPAGWSKLGSRGYNTATGWRHRTMYKISDGSETNITIPGAGASAVSVSIYRDANRAVYYGVSPNLVTIAGVDGYLEKYVAYSLTQDDVGSAFVGPGAPVTLRGQVTAGSARVGFADEPSITGTIPQRTFTGGSANARIQSLGLYDSAIAHMYVATETGADTYDGGGHAKYTFDATNVPMTANELILLSAHWKGYSVSPSAAASIPSSPAGYTLSGGPIYSGSAPSNGNPGEGNVGAKQLYRISDGSEGADIVPGDGAWASIGRVIRLKTEPGKTWSHETVTAVDTDSNTNATLLLTASSNFASCTKGDKVFFSVTHRFNPNNPPASPSLSIPGCVLSGITELNVAGTNLDPDIQIYSGWVDIIDGTASGPPSFTGTMITFYSDGVATFTRVRAT